ncbi:MAG: hypothetical protein K2I67_00020, partial [Malacoplasma sp.]|nr:hypothetical protein [Malacoplasma sp.]
MYNGTTIIAKFLMPAESFPAINKTLFFENKEINKYINDKTNKNAKTIIIGVVIKLNWKTSQAIKISNIYSLIKLVMVIP